MATKHPDFSRHPWTRELVQGWLWEVISCLFGIIIYAETRAHSRVLFFILFISTGLFFIVKNKPRTRMMVVLRQRSFKRSIKRVFWSCAVVGRSGTTPRVIDAVSFATGWRLRLNLPTGLYLKELERRLPEIEVAFNARSMRVKSWQGNARIVELIVITKSAFNEPFVSPLLNAKQVSIWEPILIGKGEFGQPVFIELAEHNLLIGGEPGSGKSVALSAIVGAVALDPTAELTLLDGKEVELAAWSRSSRKFIGPSQAEAVATLNEIHTLMNDRYHQLALSRRRKVEKNAGIGLHVVVIDELAFYLRGGEKVFRDRFAELLRDLVSRGRAAGVVVIAATQKPSHEVVPTWIRDLFSYRLAMRCTSPDASDTILGQGWATMGFSASKIDSASRGVGFLLSEGIEPVLILTSFLSDEDIEQISLRAEELRSNA